MSSTKRRTPLPTLAPGLPTALRRALPTAVLTGLLSALPAAVLTGVLTALPATLLTPPATAQPADPPDAQRLLAASDAIRNPGQPFGLTNTLTEYRNGRQVDTSTLAIWAKADPASGQYRNLIRFVAPARDADKRMLKNGNDLWFHDPASSATIRLSPQQRLLGQAANGDVMTVNLALDYRATLGAAETIQDGERQTRKAWRLDLAAASPDVTYHRIEYWIDAGDSRPIKARFFSESGHLLKTAYYRKYAAVLGRERPTETVIIDGLDPTWVTVMRTSDLRLRDVPDAWLQRDYLPRFRGG